MNIALLGAHNIEEYDSLSLLTELGYDCFAIGGYSNPAEPVELLRPAIPNAPYFPDLEAACHAKRVEHDKDGEVLPNGRAVIDWAKADLPDEVLDWADVIMVSAFEHTWIAPQWARLKESGKRIVWRTIGQSGPDNERLMRPFNDDGLEIVRYSPNEASLPNYANIVVSRRSVLRDEAKAQAQELRKQLVEGAEFDGIVTRLQSFGAFVDLGGVEGLLHVSRMGYSRVDDPAAVVTVGGKVRVRIVKIEHPGTPRERIALALADLGPDPWAHLQEQLHVGDVLTGTVVRLAPFGAFVRLSIGLDGLVHLSELSNQRVVEPREVVTPGQEVQGIWPRSVSISSFSLSFCRLSSLSLTSSA